jgi:hypothetical protein
VGEDSVAHSRKRQTLKIRLSGSSESGKEQTFTAEKHGLEISSPLDLNNLHIVPENLTVHFMTLHSKLFPFVIFYSLQSIELMTCSTSYVYDNEDQVTICFAV